MTCKHRKLGVLAPVIPRVVAPLRPVGALTGATPGRLAVLSRQNTTQRPAKLWGELAASVLPFVKGMTEGVGSPEN